MLKISSIVVGWASLKIGCDGTTTLGAACARLGLVLLDEGAEIVAFDPVGEENFKKKFNLPIEYVKSPKEALKNADVAFIFTEWKEIKNLDLQCYERLMKTPIIFDGRNCYDINLVKDHNIDYYSVGRKEVLNCNLCYNN